MVTEANKAAKHPPNIPNEEAGVASFCKVEDMLHAIETPEPCLGNW